MVEMILPSAFDNCGCFQPFVKFDLEDNGKPAVGRCAWCRVSKLLVWCIDTQTLFVYDDVQFDVKSLYAE